MPDATACAAAKALGESLPDLSGTSGSFSLGDSPMAATMACPLAAMPLMPSSIRSQIVSPRSICTRAASRKGAGSNPILAARSAQATRSSSREIPGSFAARVASAASSRSAALPSRPLASSAAAISSRRVEKAMMCSRDIPAISN